MRQLADRGHAAAEPRDERAVVLHYAKLGTALLEPHLTAKGAQQLRRVLAGDHDASADRFWPPPQHRPARRA